jgi:AbrB family looped-hinge helix DNA binding protein
MASMNGIVSIDKAGRLVVPKIMREDLHLHPGDLLEIEQQEDVILLRPQRPGTTMVKEQGIWVIDGGGGRLSNRSVLGLIEETRDERTRKLSGELGGER